MTDQTPTPRATRRERLAAASLWLPVTVISVTATLWYRDLPAVLPKQWDGDGVSSTAQTEVVIGVTGAIALVGAIVGLIALADAAADIRRVIMLFAGGAAGVAAGVWLVSAGLVVATGSAEPDAGGWPLLGVLAIAYGLVPFALSPRRHRERALVGGPSVALAASETGAWFTTLRVPVFLWSAALAAAGAVAMTVFAIVADEPGASASAVALALVAALGIAFSWLRVSVDRRGLRIVSSVFRLPITRIELSRVAGARAELIRPLEWGGWGYRILPGRSAVVLAGGPGIVVERSNGTLFAVTVPEPELPAALLTTLAAR